MASSFTTHNDAKTTSTHQTPKPISAESKKAFDEKFFKLNNQQRHEFCQKFQRDETTPLMGGGSQTRVIKGTLPAEDGTQIPIIAVRLPSSFSLFIKQQPQPHYKFSNIPAEYSKTDDRLSDCQIYGAYQQMFKAEDGHQEPGVYMYIIMAYHRSATLKDQLTDIRKKSLSEKIDLLYKIFIACQDLMKSITLPRLDLDNIVLCEDGRIKIRSIWASIQIKALDTDRAFFAACAEKLNGNLSLFPHSPDQIFTNILLDLPEKVSGYGHYRTDLKKLQSDFDAVAPGLFSIFEKLNGGAKWIGPHPNPLTKVISEVINDLKAFQIKLKMDASASVTTTYVKNSPLNTVGMFVANGTATPDEKNAESNLHLKK
jgi:hypothetical protein